MATATANQTKSESLPAVGGPSVKATTKQQLTDSNNRLALLAKKLIDKTASAEDFGDMAALLESTKKIQDDHDKFRSEHKQRLSNLGLDPEDVFEPEAIKASYRKLFPTANLAATGEGASATPKGGRPKKESGVGKTASVPSNLPLLISEFQFGKIKGKKGSWNVGKKFPGSIPKHFSGLRDSLKGEAELKKSLEEIVVPDMKEFAKTPEGQKEIDLLVAYISGKYKTREEAVEAMKTPDTKK